jgi:hypothetical protein
MSSAAAVEPEIVDPFPERGAVPHAESAAPIPALLDSARRASCRSWDFLFDSLSGRRARDLEATALPAAPGGVLAPLHAAFDELILVYFEAGREGVAEYDFERIELEVEDLIVHHDHRGVGDDPFSHHDDPPAPQQCLIGSRRYGGVDGEWMTFPSGWEPHALAPGRDRWLANDNNALVQVGLLRHDDGPRPWLVLVHGAEMGRPKLDPRLLRAQRLHDDLGVNIAMPVLPQHGPRMANKGAVRGTFPSIEMADNVHGLSQGIWDIRRTLSWIRTQEPTAIGVYGFSLGSYITSLLAGLEADLDALVLGCPVIDLVDLFIRNTPPLEQGAERLATLFERAALAHRPISPLHLDRVVPEDRILLLGAAADRLSDPVDQLRRLWEHWDRPEISWIDGGHVTYFLKDEPVAVVEEALAARGVGRLDD